MTRTKFSKKSLEFHKIPPMEVAHLVQAKDVPLGCTGPFRVYGAL